MTLKGNPVFLLTLFSICTYASAGQISGSIKQYNTELTSATPVSGADVQCYDYDPFNADDSMTSGKTTSSGSYWMSYSTRAYKWWRCGWDCGTQNAQRPDIICDIKKDGAFPHRTVKKSNHREDRVANFGTIIMYPDRKNDCTLTRDSLGYCGPASSPAGKVIHTFASSMSITDYYFRKFSDGCANHDCCYSSDVGQKECDDEFYDNLRSLCRDDQETIAVCYSAAYSFYSAVATFGHMFYEGNGRALADDEKSEEIFPEDEGFSTIEKEETALVALLSTFGCIIFAGIYFLIQANIRSAESKKSIQKRFEKLDVNDDTNTPQDA